jgi:hypothetical protein
MTREEEESGPDMRAWLPYFIQNGAYNSRPMPLGEFARAQELFVRIARTPEIRASSNWCELDDWMVSDYGLSIEDQFTLGFALMAMTHAFETDETAGRHFFISAANFEDLITKLGWTGPRIQAALSVISADRETFSREFKEKGTSAHHVAWDVLPFMRHPFLRFDDGSLVLLSARALLSWLGEGFHYRLLDSAQRRASAARSTKISRQYTALAGNLLEIYSLALVRSVHPGDRPAGAGRVYGEQPYGKKGSQMTSDIAVDLGQDLVLFEVSSSRFRAETLLLAGPEQADQDLKRVLIAKINQLSNCIDALASGVATIPAAADAGDQIDYAQVRRVWPILVTASGVTQTAPLWQYIRESTPNALHQAKVQSLTIVDLEGLEVLCFLIENGFGLHEILADKTKPEYRDLELAIWLLSDPTAPRVDIGRPQMIRAAFDAAVERSQAMMDLTRGV